MRTTILAVTACAALAACGSRPAEPVAPGDADDQARTGTLSLFVARS